MDTRELKSSRINIHLCSKMYKKVTSKYVVIAKSYQQIRGNNLTFLLENHVITSNLENLPAYVVTSQTQLYQGFRAFPQKTLPAYVVIRKCSNIKGLAI